MLNLIAPRLRFYSISLFKGLLRGESPALVYKGKVCSFQTLLNEAMDIKTMLNIIPKDRVGLLCSKRDYVPSMLAIWAAGGVAVPLGNKQPLKSLKYFVNDAEISKIVYSEEYSSLVSQLGVEMLPISKLTSTNNQLSAIPNLQVESSESALIIYTSGSTGNPKGVVHTFGSFFAQVDSLHKAWNYTHSDRLLHILPLHHIHGIVNALWAVLFAGGAVELHDEFLPINVWKRLLSTSTPITLFMGVPTNYAKLLEEDLELNNLKHVRLFISGSAALPTPIKSQWKTRTGHVLLERYGMTEIGMALSCGLSESERIDSSVGWPMPGIEVKLITNDNEKILIEDFDEDGEIIVAGELVFQTYYNLPLETDNAFISINGKKWFKTGDIACRSSRYHGAFFIKGRQSVDIIKSGGFKISALEIEREILALCYIRECAVIGIPDPVWGEKVLAVISSDQKITIDQLRLDLRNSLDPYKLPKCIEIVEEIPRNSMGKVNKKQLLNKFMFLSKNLK